MNLHNPVKVLMQYVEEDRILPAIGVLLSLVILGVLAGTFVISLIGIVPIFWGIILAAAVRVIYAVYKGK